MEMILGIVAFVVLFAVWVIIPSVLKKRHAKEEHAEQSN